MTSCTVDGCGRTTLARGLCGKHYQRWRNRGDAERTLTPTRGVFVACAVAGCEQRAAARGWCRTHYSRWVSTGDPEGLKRAPNGSGWLAHGYRLLYEPAHPLATRIGRVFEHRKVLYNKIGPGQHPCHWCGNVVSWDRKENAGKFTLIFITDHLDGNTLNNAPDNLVPSCWKCNVNRNKP